ncbi:MAG TPA: hypothetical protein VMF61_13895 [Candidatus Acidoferrales bacterium]|nr:hypothetical protein [Candidatus Acidoferrales bacterium]
MLFTTMVQRASLLASAALLLAFGAGCGSKAQAATPSALVANPTNFDGETVNVSGTAKNPLTRTRRGHTFLTYQLCDSQCIRVVQFGATATVADGSPVSVTGTFHESFGRVRRFSNVLMVGGRPGFGRMNGGSSPGASQGPG